MKLNPDCIRDILLLIEKQCDYENAFCYEQSDKPIELKNYTFSEVMYHVSQCSKYGFIEGLIINDTADEFFVNDLTPKGHNFLANIRNDNFYNKVKSICKIIGVSSLDDITRIATQSALVLIKSQFMIP